MRTAASLALPFALVGVALALAGAASADSSEPTAAPDRPPDSNGWYIRPVTVTFGPASESYTCSDPVTYSGPDTTGALVSGSCTKGDEAIPLSFEVKYDASPPTGVSGSADRGAETGGWYSRPLSVTFAGSDTTSGIASCTSATYGGPDSVAATVDGSCTDHAGNTASGSSSFKYDATPPAVSGHPGRDPDANGWYAEPVSLSFTGSDAMSGIASCSSPSTYAGPDDPAVAISGSCTDHAGNAASATVSFKYDGTNPEVTASPGRPPDGNGWYTHALSIAFDGADSSSGISSCSGPTSYDGPDGAAAAVQGTCTDNAGHTGTATHTFRYDGTAPEISGSPAREPDSNGWYNRPLDVAFKGSDGTSGVVSCTTTTYSGPDSAAASVSGGCTDGAGNTAMAAVALKYDGTPPTLELPAPKIVEADGPSGTASAGFALPKATDPHNPEPPLVSCDRGSPSAFPLGTTRVRCHADDGHGHTTSGTLEVVVRDSTPPTLNAPGPLTVSASGSDSVARSDARVASYLASPTASDIVDNRVGISNNAPDRLPLGGTRVTWTARDESGNQSTAAATITVVRAAVAAQPAAAIDTAPPGDVQGLRATAKSRKVSFTWRNPGEADFARVVITRSLATQPAQAEKVYEGNAEAFVDGQLKNGVEYRWTFRTFDRAGNGSRGVVAGALPKQVLLWEPAYGARLTVGPRFILVWARIPDATYYNVQLFYGKQKVGTFWPRQARLILGRSWRFAGRRQTLKLGEYRWYVWPGLGALKAADYGPMLGDSRFVVRGLRALGPPSAAKQVPAKPNAAKKSGRG